MDILPTPALPQGSYINLSKLLGNVVNWEVNNDSFQLISPIQKTVRSYRLKITERILNTTINQILDHDVYDNTSDVNYVFNAEFGGITRHNYLQAKYVVNKHSIASFLTTNQTL